MQDGELPERFESLNQMTANILFSKLFSAHFFAFLCLHYLSIYLNFMYFLLQSTVNINHVSFTCLLARLIWCGLGEICYFPDLSD
jgi:hypothetical protein